MKHSGKFRTEQRRFNNVCKILIMFYIFGTPFHFFSLHLWSLVLRSCMRLYYMGNYNRYSSKILSIGYLVMCKGLYISDFIRLGAVVDPIPSSFHLLTDPPPPLMILFTRISGPSGPVNSSSCGGLARYARKTHYLKQVLNCNIQETK